MQLSAKIRFIVIASLAFPTLSLAQTSPSKPSAASAAPPPAQPTQQPLAASQQPPQHAEVTYTDDKLYVSANNSSLNQILHEISLRTGMKITGGVTDERVFGQYGPDVPSKILGALLDGTGSNMLLLQATATTPAELILTPRHGGPTPPNPNAASLEDSPANRSFPLSERPQYPAPTPPEATAPGNPAPSSPTEAQSPNAVRTPQQIYEQLQHLRQQQQQQQPPNPQ